MVQYSKLFVKGMVCNRCITVIHETIKELGQQPVHIVLGEVTIKLSGDSLDKNELQKKLAFHGFSLLEDPKMTTLNELKNLVAEVYGGEFEFPEKFRFSSFVKRRLNKQYERVSDIFIALEQKSLEQYIIDYRINKIKEYLVYSDFTLADMALSLNFTSVSHLSTQFKQKTGITPSYFKDVEKEKAKKKNVCKRKFSLTQFV